MILDLSIASTRLTFMRSTHAVLETGAVVRDADVMIQWDLSDGGYDDTRHRTGSALHRILLRWINQFVCEAVLSVTRTSCYRQWS